MAVISDSFIDKVQRSGLTTFAIFGSSIWLGMVIWKRLNAKAYKELPKVSETDERTVSHLPVLVNFVLVLQAELKSWVN